MPSRPEETWFVYILQCRDGTLYTGATSDITRRVRQHNEGDAARYTRGRGPVNLCYLEVCADRSQAQVREAAVKRLSRATKQQLIASYRHRACEAELCES